MRARRSMRIPTAAQVAIGATVLAFPATAMAVTTTASSPASSGVTPAATLSTHAPHSIAFGRVVVVRGSLSHSGTGTPLELEYRPARGHWHTVARGRVHAHGRYLLRARLTRSGALRVEALPKPVQGAHAVSASPVPATAADPAPATAGATTTAAMTTSSPTPSTAANPTPSTPTVILGAVRRLQVTPRLLLSGDGVTPVAGQPVHLQGRLLPAVAGRRVRLQERSGRGWITLTSARTRRNGAFSIRFVPAATGPERVQVAFAGDRLNARAASRSELISPMQYAEVSWYNDAGETACGFHATYGIASRTLPCGSQVTLSYGGHTVTATVDDRGPFVYSRLYDLNQNVAAALGMYGVATVLASV